MMYVSQTRGFKPGGTNLTFGASGDGTPAMVLPTFKSETLDSTELGLKTEFFDGRALANVAIFDYTYKNLQAVSYTHLTLRRLLTCRSRWSPSH